MLKLLRADFFRLTRGKLIWGALAVSALFGAYLSFSKHQSIVQYGTEKTMDNLFFVWFMIVGFVLAVIISLYVGTEYSDGTLRNKLTTGSDRRALYLSNFIVCATSGIAVCLAYMAGMLAVAVGLIGVIEMPWPILLQWYAAGILMVVSICAVFTLTAMLVQNKTIVAIALILGMIAGLLLGAQWMARLNAPETYTSIETSNEGTKTFHDIPNPDYLTPEQRKVYQTMVEILPTGQCHLLADLSVVHPWRMMLFSGILIVLANLTGVAFFRRKDLK